jgi:hypothetical protein
MMIMTDRNNTSNNLCNVMTGGGDDVRDGDNDEEDDVHDDQRIL